MKTGVLLWCLGSISAQLAWSQTNPCADGETFQCQDGSTPQSPPSVCPSGAPQCCTGSGSCSEAPRPGGTGGGTGGARGGGTGGGAPGGGDSNSCSALPCPASLLGDVGLTTATGTDARSGLTFQVGENIYGPFEAGFGAQQNGILEGLGCSDGSLGHVDGGIDTLTAEMMVAKGCSIDLPRVDLVSNEYISLLDECGGHTQEYHFHERLSCLYAETGGHSTDVGQASDGQYIYGKWENFSNSELPKLDACGAHFGITPDSAGVRIYHYHVQDKPPFTIGCFGPAKTNDGDFKLVTLAECRNAYSGCGDGDTKTVETKSGSMQYDLWCPCYDATGSNVGTQELAVFSDTSATTCSGESCSFSSLISSSPSPSPSAAPSPSPSPDSGKSSSAWYSVRFSIIALVYVIAMPFV
eukprot:TRINITY_DN12563_c0_g1_i11.p1 TRINITY_DN12563_c0_g1~~TRINITY_DN12563_c0_g1_i11.p1  ORF type:complete len:411 (+),score=52.10 TRINITY_DN12563_c0_g1_i11:71-1303(+)